MNKSEFNGVLRVIGGAILAFAANVTGSHRLRFYSVRLQIAGKSQLAIGQAQKIIRHYAKRNSISA